MSERVAIAGGELGRATAEKLASAGFTVGASPLAATPTGGGVTGNGREFGGSVALGPWRVRRAGHGEMQLAGDWVFWPPRDRDEVLQVLRAAVAAGGGPHRHRAVPRRGHGERALPRGAVPLSGRPGDREQGCRGRDPDGAPVVPASPLATDRGADEPGNEPESSERSYGPCHFDRMRSQRDRGGDQ
jgi:hypothetical protein